MDFRLATGLSPIFICLAIFGLGPTLLNTIESFRTPGAGFGFYHYIRIFSDTYYLTVIWQTLLFGLGVSLICGLLGYPMALAFARAQGKAKVVLLFAIVTPLLVNVVVRSFGWMVILGPSGTINALSKSLGWGKMELMYNWFGVSLAMVHVLLPFMIISIAGSISLIDERLEEAAGMLGASPLRRFWLITFPLSRDGLVTGCILSFTLAIGSFVTVMLLGDEGTMVMPMLIYQQLTVGADWPFAAAMGTVLLVIVTLILWLQAKLQRKGGAR